MSYTITRSEERHVPKPETPDNGTKKVPSQRPTAKEIRKNLVVKREHFTRTSSIERLKRFNTFICSKNYLLLPIVLCCLRNSKHVLQSTVDPVIVVVKQFVYAFVVKLLKLRGSMPMPTMKFIYATVQHKSIYLLYKTTKQLLFALAVYTAVFGIFLQLALCLYYLNALRALLSVGFLFLCTCLLLISQINFNVLVFMDRTQTEKLKKRNGDDSDSMGQPQQKRASRKDLHWENRNANVIKAKQILCNRTISNVNLF